MAGYLPSINVTAATRGGDAVATLSPAVFGRRLAGMTITGVVGSRCDFYMGSVSPSTRFDQTSRGQSNSGDYASPRVIPPNTPVFAVWPSQGAKASQCQVTFTFASEG